MPNAIKYSTSAQTLALKKGNYWIGTGDVGKGPTSTTDYYNGITPPSGGYTIYLNKASGGPSIYTAANDSQLISLSNTISGQNFATAAAALDWYNAQTDKMVFNRDYESIVTNGLVLNLDAGFTPSYPTAGTIWYDVSSGGNNGTLTNGPTFNSGNGGSIVFDGTNDYVNLGNVLNTLTNITYEVWFNTTASSPYDALMEKDRNPWVSAALHLIEGKVGWIVGNVSGNPYSTNVYTTSTYNNGAWHQAVGTYDRNNINLYVDGVLQATTASTDPIIYSTASFQIGYHFESFSYYEGKISKASVYNRALSAAEVLQNYNAQKSRFGL